MGSAASPDLRQLLAEALEVPAEAIRPETRFVEDCGGASINLIIVVMMLEDLYGVEISDEEAETLTCLSDVESFLAARAK